MMVQRPPVTEEYLARFRERDKPVVRIPDQLPQSVEHARGIGVGGA